MTHTPTPHAPTPAAAKQLTRSRSNRQVAGVCGGVATYTGIDATIIRLAVVLVTLFTWGLGAVAYLLAAIIMPDEPAAQASTGPEPTYAPPSYSTPPTEPTFPVTTPAADSTPTPASPEPSDEQPDAGPPEEPSKPADKPTDTP